MNFGVADATAIPESYVLVANLSDDRVRAFDPETGELVNGNFFNSASFGHATDFVRVGNEIWVSDEARGRIYRFGIGDRALKGEIEIRKVRGLEYANGKVYAVQPIDGHTGIERGIVTIDPDTYEVGPSFQASRSLSTYWDVVSFQGDLLVSSVSTGFDGIFRFSADGDYLGEFHESPWGGNKSHRRKYTQIHVRDNGDLLVGAVGFNADLYLINSEGDQTGIFSGLGGVHLGPTATSAVYGTHEFGNGLFLTAGAGFRNAQLITIPGPHTAVLLGVSCLVVRRRRS